jgi:hypothetical protein
MSTEKEKIIEQLGKPVAGFRCFKRDIYLAAVGQDYWITYRGGGPFSKQAVSEMVASGILVRKYETGDCFELAEHRRKAD